MLTQKNLDRIQEIISLPTPNDKPSVFLLVTTPDYYQATFTWEKVTTSILVTTNDTEVVNEAIEELIIAYGEAMINYLAINMIKEE